MFPTHWAGCPTAITLEHLLCAEPCSKHFCVLDHLNLQQRYEVHLPLIIPSLKGEDTEAQGLYNLPEATWLVSGGAGTTCSGCSGQYVGLSLLPQAPPLA